jgi:hypothetical protein
MCIIHIKNNQVFGNNGKKKNMAWKSGDKQKYKTK